MKYEEVTIDGKKETIVVDFDPEFEDDRFLDEDFENTAELPLSDVRDSGDSNG